MCVCFFLTHIGVRTLAVTKGYQISADRKEMARLESELAEIKMERARQRSPESLERLANDLSAQGKNFAAPRPQQLIFVSGTEND